MASIRVDALYLVLARVVFADLQLLLQTVRFLPLPELLPLVNALQLAHHAERGTFMILHHLAVVV